MSSSSITSQSIIPSTILIIILLLILSIAASPIHISHTESQNLKHEILQMFDEAYDAYKTHAFPKDELRPLSCSGRNTWGDYSLTLIDSLDAILIVKKDYSYFVKELYWMLNHVTFNRDISVSIFETNIRIVGGLLSAYIILRERETIYRGIYDDSRDDVDAWMEGLMRKWHDEGPGDDLPGAEKCSQESPPRRSRSKWFSTSRDNSNENQLDDNTLQHQHVYGELLHNATSVQSSSGTFSVSPQFRDKFLDQMMLHILDKVTDLADRLLPAFDTPTKIPFGSINLKHGVAFDESRITCTASAGTFLLEFGLLSNFTNNPKYIKVAREALHALFNTRSKDTGLVGNHVNIDSGQWIYREAGIGGSMDSLYEYLMKGWLVFGDREYLDMFEVYFKSIQKHLYRSPWYVDVDMHTAQQVFPIFNSLQSFWPGTLSSLGRVDIARETLLAFHSVWRKFGAVPEGYNFMAGLIQSNQQIYPLRPEVAESAYHMYRATGDPLYQRIGRDMIRAIAYHTKVKCGYANIKDVSSMQLEDKMESFFIAETLKYLYLLFDEGNVVNQIPHTFNTEAHIIPLIFYDAHSNFPEFRNDSFAQDPALLERAGSFENYQCPTVPYFSTMRFGPLDLFHPSNQQY
mmetsp:Transcript_5694/g.21489  ORF Transcript_5694/g.21489 Transcript_5694/m.21489 type:complete len:631 (-) Transcript_5694:2596-4488(-)